MDLCDSPGLMNLKGTRLAAARAVRSAWDLVESEFPVGQCLDQANRIHSGFHVIHFYIGVFKMIR